MVSMSEIGYLSEFIKLFHLLIKILLLIEPILKKNRSRMCNDINENKKTKQITKNLS